MRWCRYHQRFMGILALFALGLELVFSFAHVHLEGAHAPSGVPQSYAVSSGRPPAGTPDAPAAPQPDYCAVCGAIGLLSNGLSGAPPAVAAPAPIHFTTLAPAVESRISVARFYPFRTRAPPVV